MACKHIVHLICLLEPKKKKTIEMMLNNNINHILEPNLT
jgi:hypothetical protein